MPARYEHHLQNASRPERDSQGRETITLNLVQIGPVDRACHGGRHSGYIGPAVPGSIAAREVAGLASRLCLIKHCDRLASSHWRPSSSGPLNTLGVKGCRFSGRCRRSAPGLGVRPILTVLSAKDGFRPLACITLAAASVLQINKIKLRRRRKHARKSPLRLRHRRARCAPRRPCARPCP
jgi:hypothetical protein